jgi:hypothetical protein
MKQLQDSLRRQLGVILLFSVLTKVEHTGRSLSDRSHLKTVSLQKSCEGNQGQSRPMHLPQDGAQSGPSLMAASGLWMRCVLVDDMYWFWQIEALAH